MANSNSPNGFKPKGKPLRQNTYLSAGAIEAGDLCLSPSAGVVAAMTGGEAAALVLGAALHAVSASGLAVEVADHPDQLYAVQSTSALSSDIGSYCKVASGATTAFHNSQQGVSAVATTVTLPLQIQGLDGDIKNSYGQYARVIVRINTFGA
jgi:hypothetical protein